MAAASDYIFINYDNVENSAGTISGYNRELKGLLEDIERLINSLDGDWESDAGVEIRSKISGMKPRFEQYYDIVDNYVIALRNALADYKGTESVNTSNAEQFI